MMIKLMFIVPSVIAYMKVMKSLREPFNNQLASMQELKMVKIVVEVEFEIVVEVIGETKMRVSILGPVENDCDTDDEEDEIDQQINPNFLKNSPFRGE